jgi:hypothetical protein
MICDLHTRILLIKENYHLFQPKNSGHIKIFFWIADLVGMMTCQWIANHFASPLSTEANGSGEDYTSSEIAQCIVLQGIVDSCPPT